MNVNVDKKSGQPKVSFKKRERDVLAEAAGVLDMLGRYADYEPAAQASKSVASVLRHFVPEQKEFPFEKDEQKASETQPASSGTETTLPGAVPDVPDTGLQPAGGGDSRSRKRPSTPHGAI